MGSYVANFLMCIPKQNPAEFSFVLKEMKVWVNDELVGTYEECQTALVNGFMIPFISKMYLKMG